MSKKLTSRDLDDATTDGRDESGWLITLSDIMMLLLTFFVMLFSASTTLDDSYLGMLRKIGDALGGKSLIERKAGPDQFKKVNEDINKLIISSNLIRQVHLTSDTRGAVLYAEGDIFFDAGSALLKPDILRFLKRIAVIIRKTEYKVIVEGHTDDQPTKNEHFPSNWELSSARASSVIRYFIEQEKLYPRRFISSGYAEFKPRYALIPENRAKNRRVEIVIMREKM